MNHEPRYGVGWQATFGPFCLSPSERRLERDGVPVRLGGRALDLLIALVERAGELVTKKDLIDRVWPHAVVEEGSLRFHLVAVRKALGDGVGSSRYVVNTANKGYTFVALVERHKREARPGSSAVGSGSFLPALASAPIGRDDDASLLVARLGSERLVTIVGPGGIGKTTVAILAAQSSTKAFGDDVHFVDLSLTSDVALVCSTVASAVGQQNCLDDLQALVAHLAERNALLVLDCCEHVVDGVAELAESLIRGCSRVRLLVTSREPLRAAGEFVHRLQPLAFPAEGEGMSIDTALSFPAVKLFVERAAAGGSGFELKESDAPLASQLCRELQGIALAIELAAGRIEALGLKAITSQFDANIRLLWHGRRTAVPRHQTLAATLDWSFNLLTEDEKRLLCRLSVFTGSFALDAGIEICCFDLDRSLAYELIASLVSKSLVMVDAGGATLRYGMLDTTRYYCAGKLRDSGAEASIMQRFADHFGAWARPYAVQRLDKAALGLVALDLANLRSTLEWLFRDGHDPDAAVRLAASICPLLLQLSKVGECARWAGLALGRMPPDMVGSTWEVHLQGALGQSLMYSMGDSAGEAAAAFRRGVEVAVPLGDFRSALNLLNGSVALQQREGQYADALATARRAQSLLTKLEDPASRAIVDSLMGFALHLVGDVDEALPHWERCFAATSSGATSRLGFDFHIRALCGLARTLWLTGHYARAITVAEETIAKARDSGHAVTYCIALIWAGSVHVWARDVQRLHEIVETIERVATKHSLIPYLNVASITRGQVLIAQGRPAEGVERIRTAVEVLRQCRYEMVTSLSLGIMARGLSDMSLHAAALGMCDNVESLIRQGGDFLRMPEIFATRGYCLAAAGQPELSRTSYLAAMELSRSQGVKSGQVRAGVALAQQLISIGRREEASLLLRPLVIEGGVETSVDLTLARDLLG